MIDDEERAFLAWFTENGGWIDPSLSLEKIPGMGRGLVATRPIAENERLFTIPRSMLMNLDTSALAKTCQAAEKAKPPRSGCSWLDIMNRGWCPIILMLMWEHWRASSLQTSKQHMASISWGPYFGIMPKEFSTPMFWNSDELEELKGTDVEDKIGRAEAESDYHECVLPYIQQYPNVFLGTLPSSDVQAGIDRWYHVNMYHRMGSSILSRSFHVKRDLTHAEPDEADISSAPAEVAVVRTMPQNDQKDESQRPHEGIADEEGRGVEEDEDEQDEQGDEHEENEGEDKDDDEDENEEEEEEEEDVRDISMVPMADMLNAKFGSENTRCFYKREALEMRCTRAIAVGEQLLNTYGNPPNSDLLRRYGFVDEPNRGDLLELPAEIIVDAAAAKLRQVTGAADDAVRACLMPRFEWACTELGLDEVFLLCRLSKPTALPPYAGTLPIDAHSTLTSANKRALSHAASDISEDLIGFVRLLCLTQEGFERAKKKEALPKAQLDAVEPLDNHTWPGSPPQGAMIAVASILSDALLLRTRAYPTSWPDTSKALVAQCEMAPPENRRRMALVVRAGEQAIVQEHNVVLQLALEHARAQANADMSRTKPDHVSTKKARRM